MSILQLVLEPRYLVYTFSIVLAALLLILLPFQTEHVAVLAPLCGVALALAALGTHDLIQTRHSILRNYPITAHLRFLFEDIRPELRQYFFEGEKDGAPFPRDTRSIVYQRSKRELETRPFGTQYDVYDPEYEWISHSVAPAVVTREPFRTRVGGPGCSKPYDLSVFNISAMSFGSLSANAILALNRGAKIGGFAHDTGEGGVSRYHREHGGDLIWELGSGYFGCRNDDGAFSPDRFAAMAQIDQIKMIEIKLSQGAKPGHGGMLPAAKVSPEIAAARGIPVGRDCISPARHPAFSTPIELMHFIDELRRLSGGKPVGFKLCIGHPWEFLGICKAMLETGSTPDFIVVDGKEGGTGAAPMEFMDHVGVPLRYGLSFVRNSLVGVGLRDRIRIGASGQIISAFDIVRAVALGADWCNSARGFMFALGCIQSQSCHTDRCPVGVATQDPTRTRALVADDKAQRVANFHGGTMHALAELVAAAGLTHPSQLTTDHVAHRRQGSIATLTDLFPPLQPGELLTGTKDPRFANAWALARADCFAPRG